MRQEGQSFFEVVIALGIVSLILVAIVAPATVSIRNTASSRNKALATRHTQEAVEWLRGQRDADWLIFAQHAQTAVWCLPELGWTGTSHVATCSEDEKIINTIFIREVEFTNVDLATIQATVKTTWTDSLGVREVRTSTYFTDWRTGE